jgi:formiminoglutamase
MTSNFSFHPFTEDEKKELTKQREGETKLGQSVSINCYSDKVKYVILGIQESIGPQSNLGLPGAENAFEAFLQRFLNMQSNRHLPGENIAIAGRIKQNTAFNNVEEGKILVNELDDLVVKIIQPILLSGKIPIVIGGGHNNAFPLIKATCLANESLVSVINLDPHADCRRFEGRHSGNSFSYALAENYLYHYSVLGLHKSYNSEYLLDFMSEHKFHYTFFEDYLFDSTKLIEDIRSVCDLSSKNKNTGIELDMDSIAYMPSSAFSPTGITIEQARCYVILCAQIANVRYLHLPEAAPQNDTERKTVGKALAYLVWDFIHSGTKDC